MKRHLEIHTDCSEPFGVALQNRYGMERQLLATGNRSSAVQPGSCGELWARAGQKILEEQPIYSDVQHWNFGSLQYQEAEGPRGLCSLLHNFCSGWLRPEKHTKEQMLDLVVLEQLLALLPLRMESWVRECGAETSSQAVALAEGFILSQAEEQKEQIELQPFPVEIRDLEGRKNASDLSQELFFWRISQEDPSQDASEEKHRVKFSGLYGKAEKLVESPNQEGLLSFEEVAVYFSEDEWSQLNAPQKALHWEVMLENYRNMASLGNNGQENTDFSEPFQVFSPRDGMEKPAIQMKVEKHERNLSCNWNRKSSSSIDRQNQDCDAQQGKLKNKYIGNNVKVFKGKFDVNEQYPTQTKDYICRNSGMNYNWTFPFSHKNGHLISHKTIHTEGKPYKCLECGKSFRTSSQLTFHKRSHIGEKPSKCLEYGKSFTKSTQLATHNWIHTGEKPYKCTEYGRGFKKRCTSHKRIHTGEKPYNCMECGKSFRESRSLTSHKRIHTGEKPFQYMECGKAFIRSSRLTSHKRIHTEEPYKCGECGKGFVNSSHLNLHKRIHAGEKPYKCMKCGETFAQSNHLNSHKSHTGEKPHKCVECGKSFTTISSLTCHTRIHSGEKPYKCMECGEKFIQSRYLISHQRKHTGEKPYKCMECGKSFGQSSSFISHKKIHTGEKPFKCMDCGKAFLQNRYLISHKRIHTGEKPYKCRECGKTFAQSSHLTSHNRVHTGEKPHKCVECGKSFSTIGSLTCHKRIHTGEKPYKCMECGKGFSENRSLMRHKRIPHSGEAV